MSEENGPVQFDAYNPGTDLVLSLFAVMAFAFVFMAGEQTNSQKKINGFELQISASQAEHDKLRMDLENERKRSADLANDIKILKANATTEKELKALVESLETTKKGLEQERDKLMNDLNLGEKEKALLQQQLATFSQELKTLKTDQIKSLALLLQQRTQITELEKQIADWKGQKDLQDGILAAWKLQSARDKQQELVVRKDLLGIRGELKKVVFIIDRSGSMKDRPNNSPGGAAGATRWDEVKSLIRDWLEKLPVQEAALVFLGDNATPFPATYQFRAMDLQGRAELIAQLNSVQPDQWTNTLAAIEEAHKFKEADTIIMFSDGRPKVANEDLPVQPIYSFIQRQAQSGRKLPINVIAIGDYFETETARFLLRLTHESGGAYLGK